MTPASRFAAAPRVADLPGSRRLTLTLVCRRNPAHDHAALVAAVAAHLPHQRRPFDAATYAATFGASRPELRRIGRAAEALGFTVLETDPGTRLVIVEATIRTIERAFAIDLARFEVDGRHHHGHDTPYTLPPTMAGLVEAVLGLDDLPVVSRPRLAAAAAPSGAPLLPQALIEHYRFPKADGAGQTIALLQMGGGFTTADLRAYFARVGVTRALPHVTGPNRPVGAATLKALVAWMNGTGPHIPADDAPAARWTFETTMDVELASVLAPGAAIDVHCAGQDSAAGVVRALRGLLHGQRRPSVLSCSWALGTLESLETQTTGGQKGVYALTEDALHEAAVLGITVCAASGDDGSTANGVKGGALEVDYPAASAFALAVGGTSIPVVGGRLSADVVWNATTAGLAFASGGGLARHPAGVTAGPPAWQAPTLKRWLSGKPVGAVPLASIARGVPDVAAHADFNSGCLLIVGGVETRAGGTSASAPLWAALVARLNSGLSGAARKPLGLVTPTLYDRRVAKTFMSVREGRNNLRRAAGPYHAASGWDPCTGLGVPNGQALLAALQRLAQS